MKLFICFLLAIAEVYNTEGNERYRQEDLSNAIHFYTEGINVNCKDEELKTELYSNRAEAYFCLGENFVLSRICLTEEFNIATLKSTLY